MNKIKLAALLLATVGAITACTNTDMAKLSAIGQSAHVVCYSANTKILDTDSTGVVHTVDHSDGWEFQDKADGKLVRVTGSCVVRS